MARNWSEAALAVFDAYPWRSEEEKAKARAESEMVSFGDAVEPEDLPLKVRQWRRRDAMCRPSAWRWNGESLDELTREFETAILTQALEASGGNASAAARALGTTLRIVDYKMRRLGLTGLKANKKKRK